MIISRCINGSKLTIQWSRGQRAMRRISSEGERNSPESNLNEGNGDQGRGSSSGAASPGIESGFPDFSLFEEAAVATPGGDMVPITSTDLGLYTSNSDTAANPGGNTTPTPADDLVPTTSTNLGSTSNTRSRLGR